MSRSFQDFIDSKGFHKTSRYYKDFRFILRFILFLNFITNNKLLSIIEKELDEGYKLTNESTKNPDLLIASADKRNITIVILKNKCNLIKAHIFGYSLGPVISIIGRLARKLEE